MALGVRKTIRLTVLCLVALIVMTAVCAVAVSARSGKSYGNIDDVPKTRVALLLGTSPLTAEGRKNHYFNSRVRAAAELYKAGKIEIIVASGGDYRERKGYDEPKAMADSLVVRGVPADRIILDYEGTNTVRSIAKLLATLPEPEEQVLIISQKYHNDRALFMARHYGLNAVAYNAAQPISRIVKNWTREGLARVKMFYTLYLTPMLDEHSFSADSLNRQRQGLAK